LLEKRLFDCYLAESAGETLDPRLADHLTDCPSCAARYADLATFMDDLRGHGAADADRIFTPERLRLQHQHILRRIEQASRPARVITFPGRFVRRTMNSSLTDTSRTAPRWIAGAAAAGLFVGVALGASYQFGAHDRVVTQTIARQTPVRMTTGGMRAKTPAQLEADDAFLSDLEVALERPHTRELVAFDAFTPHVREVTNTR
jgi:anti-sigma factor RsiW